MSLYGVIGYHVTLSEGHMIANHSIYWNTCAPSCGNFDLFVTNIFILYRSDMSPLKYLVWQMLFSYVAERIWSLYYARHIVC